MQIYRYAANFALICVYIVIGEASSFGRVVFHYLQRFEEDLPYNMFCNESTTLHVLRNVLQRGHVVLQLGLYC